MVTLVINIWKIAWYRNTIVIHELCDSESVTMPLKLLIDLLIFHYERWLSESAENAIKHLCRIFTRLLESWNRVIRPKPTADLKLKLVPTLTMSSGDFGSSHSKSPWYFGTDTERGLLGAILGANRVSTVRVMRFILCKSKNNPIKIYTVHSRQWLVFWASKTHHGIEG